MSFTQFTKTVSNSNCAGNNRYSDSGLSLVDPQWELIDPNPDIHALFLHFNDVFFHGRLAGCEVRWSPRMTLCAGLCCYEGRGGLCSIRLSQPLLKFRPRKDLLETLLHEMIHAYLFVTDNNRDRDGHGPEFLSHMHRINTATGVNISVYHSFHQEVNSYRQHKWRCTGRCRERHPFYGWVSRTMNRPPGPNDTWWEAHRSSCEGQFEKVAEPEGFGEKKKRPKESTSQGNPVKKKKSNDEKSSKQPDLELFFGKGHKLGSSGENNTKLPVKDDIIDLSGKILSIGSGWL